MSSDHLSPPTDEDAAALSTAPEPEAFPKGLFAAGTNTENDDTIKTLEYFRVRPRWLFVRVETQRGIVGWGEATLEGHTEAVEGALTELRNRFIGWDPANIEDIWQTAYCGRFYRGGPVLMSALSGLDIALWDIKGKTLGVPVWQLLGGKVRVRCPVYGWIGGDKPSDVVEAAKARQAQGFKAVKMNGVESTAWLDSPTALDAAVERCQAVQALGLDVALDFHGRLHKPLAKMLAARLEPLRPLFIEEPLLPGHIPELRALYERISVPIALGERLFTRADVRPYLEAGCVDIIQPDVAHAGGITEVKKIANMAETYDVAFAPHCPLGPIAFAACLQLGFSTPNFVICETSLGIHYNSPTHDLLTYVTSDTRKLLAPVDGGIALLTAPGLGIEIDEARVRREAEEYGKDGVPTWSNPLWRGKDGEVREW